VDYTDKRGRAKNKVQENLPYLLVYSVIHIILKLMIFP